MNAPKNDIRELFIRYFKQQQELFGTNYSISAGQVGAIEQALAPDSQSSTGPGLLKPSTALSDFYHEIKDCTKCPLGYTRTKFVFGSGNPKADAMLIGEAPGAEEDRVGEPFVGHAGQLLTRMLNAIDLKRDEVFIANILKCRPPNNRDPQPDEVDQCEPYLHRQIHLIQPRVILALGRISGQTLLKTHQSLAQLRGKLHLYQYIPMVITYHPAALLRNPGWKYAAWDDLRYFKKIYSAALSGEPLENVTFETKERNA